MVHFAQGYPSYFICTALYIQTHVATHLQWEAITCWVLVEVFKIHIVDDRLVEDRQIHLLRQLGCKSGFTSTCKK